jgi:hypothetical protein
MNPNQELGQRLAAGVVSSPDHHQRLLLEELIERRARVFYFGHSSRRLALDGLASFKKGTLVAQLLLRDALGYRFPALKSRAGIEAHAVLARVQIAVTLGTLCVKRNAVNLNVDHCSAQGTPGHLPEGGHLWRANVALLLICRLRPWLSFFVLIAALLVLSIHENLLLLRTGK